MICPRLSEGLSLFIYICDPFDYRKREVQISLCPAPLNNMMFSQLYSCGQSAAGNEIMGGPIPFDHSF